MDMYPICNQVIAEFNFYCCVDPIVLFPTAVYIALQTRQCNGIGSTKMRVTANYDACVTANYQQLWFFRGYEDHPSKVGSKVWNYNLARKNAGLDGKRKITSSKKKKSTPRKKARKKRQDIRGTL